MAALRTLTGDADFPAYRYRAKLSRVVDGDTIRVVVDLGMRISREVSLRIANIDAPEIYGANASPEGRAAADYLAALLESGNKPLYIATEKDKTSFDRYVATVYVEDRGELVSVGDGMIVGGHAVASEG